jgi:hypothetical protein
MEPRNSAAVLVRQYRKRDLLHALLREHRQRRCTCLTVGLAGALEQANNLRNGSPNELLKLDYNVRQ